jgi:signal transduction histidine kinase
MRAAMRHLWHAVCGRALAPLPPLHVVREYSERRARVQRQWLPSCGTTLALVTATRWGAVGWTTEWSDSRSTLLLATQVVVVSLAVWLTRSPQLPVQTLVIGTGMFLVLIASEAVHCAVLPDPIDSFTLVLICYLLGARLLLSGSLLPQLLVSAGAVVAQVIALAVAGSPLAVVAGNGAAFALLAGLLLVDIAVTRQEQLERLYRRRMNAVAFAMASRPASPTDDVQSTVREITELGGQTLGVTGVEVWLPDETRTVMCWLDGYDCTSDAHPPRDDVLLRDHPGYASSLDREPLVQSYELPGAAGSDPICPHVPATEVAAVLEAAVRVRGRTGVLCVQQKGRRRSWTHDEERFASYLAHLVALAIEAWERHRAQAVLQASFAELEQRSAELSETVAALNEHIAERRNVERQLRDSQTRLRALSTRLLQVQEEERRRMAREIHDDLGQTLTALRLDLAWLGRRLEPPVPVVGEKLERMATLVDATVESVQAIARNLRPPILDDVGLAAAIEWQVREFEARTGIACRLTIDRDDIRVDADRSIAVFRLVQEALTNVARHAQATRVTIAVQEVFDRLLVRIRDNGRGFRREAMRSGSALGLLGMRERVHLFGGTLRIEGRPGRGAVVRAEIPLLEDPERATGEVG